MWVDKKQNATWQCQLETQKPIHNLVFIRRCMASRSGRAVLPLHSALWGETSLRVLCAALESSVQGQGPIGVGLEKSHKNYQRAGAPLLQGKSETDGVAQTGEEKALEISHCSVSLLQGVQVLPHKKFGDKAFSKTRYKYDTLLFDLVWGSPEAILCTSAPPSSSMVCRSLGLLVELIQLLD